MVDVAWAKLQTFNTGLEADIARGILESAEVPVLVPGQQSGIFGPGFQGGQAGGITMFVPADALEHARELLGMEDEE